MLWLYKGGWKYSSILKGDEKEEIIVYKSESNIASKYKTFAHYSFYIKLNKHQVSQF